MYIVPVQRIEGKNFPHEFTVSLASLRNVAAVEAVGVETGPNRALEMVLHNSTSAPLLPELVKRRIE